jgi:tetratricopeptide (TPR) repeat protein
LNPNYPLTHEWYSSLLIGTGRFEEGLREIFRAEELDPLSLREMTLVVWSYYQVRRFEEAINKAQQIIELDRNYPQGHFQLGNALLEVGEVEKGLAALREGAKLMGGAALPIEHLVLWAGCGRQTRRAESVRTELLTSASTSYVKEYFLATAHLALGYHDEALTSWRKRLRSVIPGWFGGGQKRSLIRCGSTRGLSSLSINK